MGFANVWLMEHRESLGESLRVVEIFRQVTDGSLFVRVGRKPKATGSNNVESELMELNHCLKSEFREDKHYFGIIVAADNALLDRARIAREISECESDIQNFRSVELGGGKNG